MSTDPLINLTSDLIAKQKIITASASLEVELSERNGGGPTIEILRVLKARAAESLVALVSVNFCDPKERVKAITLQNEVKRYDEFIGCIRDIISEGRRLDAEMNEEEREELLDVLVQTEEGRAEAVALGLINENPRD
jgi:hypothetical protein